MVELGYGVETVTLASVREKWRHDVQSEYGETSHEALLLDRFIEALEAESEFKLPERLETLEKECKTLPDVDWKPELLARRIREIRSIQ